MRNTSQFSQYNRTLAKRKPDGTDVGKSLLGQFGAEEAQFIVSFAAWSGVATPRPQEEIDAELLAYWKGEDFKSDPLRLAGRTLMKINPEGALLRNFKSAKESARIQALRGSSEGN